MTAFLTSLFPGLTTEGIAVLIVATFLGGLVRGFTGFGFAMVFMPLASVVVGPVAALGLIDMPSPCLWGSGRRSGRNGARSSRS